MIQRAAAALLALGVFASGCGVIEDLKENPPQAPTAELATVTLTDAPTLDSMLAWTCFEFGGTETTCGLLGYDSKPGAKKMQFSFDIAFDMFNPNELFPVPLVELLLGVDVYDDNSLGVVCVSFCDPEKEDCTPTQNAEDACQSDDETIDSFDDLVPTVDDLLDLADDALDGELDENFQFRVIPEHSVEQCEPEGTQCSEETVDGELMMCCGDECSPIHKGCDIGKAKGGKTCAICDGWVEAHIGFDFDVDVFLTIIEDLFLDAFDSVISGGSFQFTIPYTMDGTLFFDVPQMGRAVIPFGPFSDDFVI